MQCTVCVIMLSYLHAPFIILSGRASSLSIQLLSIFAWVYMLYHDAKRQSSKLYTFTFAELIFIYWFFFFFFILELCDLYGFAATCFVLEMVARIKNSDKIILSKYFTTIELFTFHLKFRSRSDGDVSDVRL